MRVEADLTGTTKKDGHPVNPEDVESVRYRAGMYGLLASLFNQRVSAEFVRRLKGEGVDVILAAVQIENLLPEIRQGIDEIARFVKYAGNQPDKEVEQELAVDWTRLFRGVSPKYGPLSPCEGIYLEGEGETDEIMEDVYRHYKNEGVTVGAASQNRPDYIGIELDFMRHLSELEASAMDAGDKERASEYSKTADAFRAEHLGQWCGKFCDLAITHAKTGFYRGALRLTKGIVNQSIEIRWVGDRVSGA